MRAAELHDDVRLMLDPQGRGRQYVASALGKLDGARVGGFVLTMQATAGQWGAATYAVHVSGNREPHRGHRGHRNGGGAEPVPTGPMPPMVPMPDSTGDNAALSTPEDATVDRSGYL